MNAPNDELNPPPATDADTRDVFSDVDEAPPPADAERQIDNLPPVMPRIDEPGHDVAAWDENVPEELYHADKSAVSSSGGKKLLEDTPLHFYDAWAQPYVEDEEESGALRLGTLLHLCLLKPKEYTARVVLAKKFDRRTKEGKAAAAAFEKDLPNKAIIVDANEKRQIEEMALAVLAHPIAGDLIRSKHLRTELTGYFTDPVSRVRCRVRLDGYEVTPNGERTIIDLKSIHRARLADIERAVENFKYAHQAVTYIEAAMVIDKIPIEQPPPLYAWIFVEKTSPYAVRVYYPDERMLADAAVERTEAMKTLARCIRTNKWPGYDESAQPLSRPAWALKRAKQ